MSEGMRIQSQLAADLEVYRAKGELIALRAENARLKEALQGMVKLVDDGLLVRSIANDHIAGWGIRALPIVQALQQAAFALQPVRDNHD